MTDPVSRSDDLDEQLIIVKRSSVLQVKTALKGFITLIGLLLMILGGIVGIALDTNKTVKDRKILEDRNAELEETVLIQEDLIKQATDAIVLLINTLEENGIDPPEIIIRHED